jgi:hypothetical protein
VIVVADPDLETLGVNAFLNGIFQSYVAGLNVKTLMSIQELEDVLPCTQAGYISWAEPKAAPYADRGSVSGWVLTSSRSKESSELSLGGTGVCAPPGQRGAAERTGGQRLH